MIIGSRDTKKEVLIIAEIGNNHEGSFEAAVKMIKAAAFAGAHAVKFQSIRAESLVSSSNAERFKQLKSFELSRGQYRKLSRIAREEGILFLSTPFDIESVHFLDRIVPAFKIASGDNDFYPLLEEVALTGKPIIMSSGLAGLKQINKVKMFIEKKWKKMGIKQELAILHCVSSYPVPLEEANLSAITTLRRQLNCMVGYSDHTVGIEAAVISAALGARIIEKHFTLDKNYSSFRDHKLSADPKEFAQMVKRIKETLLMLGDGKKMLQKSELNNLNKMRRSMVAQKKLLEGAILEAKDIAWLRVGEGIPPSLADKMLGKRILRTIKKDEPVLLKDLN